MTPRKPAVRKMHARQQERDDPQSAPVLRAAAARVGAGFRRVIGPGEEVDPARERYIDELLGRTRQEGEPDDASGS